MPGRTSQGKRRTRRLFGPHELKLKRTGEARLRDLARIPSRPLSTREARDEEAREAIQRLRARAAELASMFGLRYAAIEAEQDGVVEHYGVCYHDGVIRIRLRHATTDRLLKESSLVDTLCHELAHLRHLDHSPRFRRLYLKILEAARQLGYYRPGPEIGRGPRQMPLFSEVDGG